eukprot:CAMPEP_0183292594 /NCGR_PEP_ID=MMETSP0160_2-20130417/1594_1 /TAXON_ID=2839 ORGANISM="Odontella Sinensis, Strain Grunow 1884" /NCGR_SAMPLE_ID=MMETSP0160_2 /ASSEMBLY_ACC=CAM_ASM_000250 /LENGTH=212 /DNA_ID=CAMNT_0025453567 /DNA_START=28 /DNA_END=666 /DNA_ORIENTATION=-
MKLAILTALLGTAAAFLPAPLSGVPHRAPTFLREGEDAAEEPAAEPEAFGDASKRISGLTSGVETIFTSEEISRVLPHRYPFLLVDKVVEYEAGKKAVGIKCVTVNEPQFTGHFPDKPIMPGVLQVEALAQLCGVMCLRMEGIDPEALFLFAGVDGVKWKRPVVPGDTLVMEVELKKWNARFGLAKASAIATVDGEVACEVKQMTFAVGKFD